LCPRPNVETSWHHRLSSSPEVGFAGIIDCQAPPKWALLASSIVKLPRSGLCWHSLCREGTNHTLRYVERLCRRRQPARLPEVGKYCWYDGLGESTFGYSATILRVIILGLANKKICFSSQHDLGNDPAARLFFFFCGYRSRRHKVPCPQIDMTS
jgi:hypothetical protein